MTCLSCCPSCPYGQLVSLLSSAVVCPPQWCTQFSLGLFSGHVVYFQAVVDPSLDFCTLPAILVAAYMILPDDSLVFVLPTLTEMTEIVSIQFQIKRALVFVLPMTFIASGFLKFLSFVSVKFIHGIFLNLLFPRPFTCHMPATHPTSTLSLP